MGKLNAAKLANFAEVTALGPAPPPRPAPAADPEHPRHHLLAPPRLLAQVGVYALLGSPEHSLLDSKEFYRPVVTPYELQLALTGDEWSGEFILDYGRLLPRLKPPDADAAPSAEGGGGGGAAAAAEEEEDDDGCDAPPEFSLLTGRLIAAAPSGSAAASTAHGGQLTLAHDGTLVQAGQFALAQSGAEALARRHFRGLEPRLGEHAPAVVQEGRSGIASGFTGEGTPGEAHG